MNRVREFRKALGMTQAALGEAAGIHPIQVCFIEKGRTKKPYLKTMIALAGALGCSVAEVFPDAKTPGARTAGIAAGILEVSERFGQGRCRWCGRLDVKDQAAVLSVAGEAVFETGHLRCLAEYIAENTDRQGNWKKHRNTGLR